MLHYVVGNVASGRLGLDYVSQSRLWWVELYRKSSQKNLRPKENVCGQGREVDGLSQAHYVNVAYIVQICVALQATRDPST